MSAAGRRSGVRRQLRRAAVSDCQLSRARRWSTWSAGSARWCAGRLSAILAAEGNLRFADEPPNCQRLKQTSSPLTRRQIIHAWVPWVVLSVLVCLWGTPDFRAMLDGGNCLPSRMRWRGNGKISLQIPRCTSRFIARRRWRRSPRRRPRRQAGASGVRFQMAFSDRHGHFLAAVISAFWLGIGPANFVAAVCARRSRRCAGAADDRVHVWRWPSRRSTAAATPHSAWRSPRRGRSIRSSRHCWVGWVWR